MDDALREGEVWRPRARDQLRELSSRTARRLRGAGDAQRDGRERHHHPRHPALGQDRERVLQHCRDHQEWLLPVVSEAGQEQDHAVQASPPPVRPRLLELQVAEGRPHVVDAMKNGEVNLIVNTTEGRQSILDSASIRRTALEEKIYCTTTLEGGRAVCSVIRNKELWSVERLQDLHAKIIT